MSESFLHNRWLSLIKLWWFPLLFSMVSFQMWNESPLLLHTIAEFFAISVTLLILVVAWNTFILSRHYYLMWLGIGYISVGLIDVGHTLTFKGMPFLTSNEENITLQFWIVARFFETAVLLIAPYFLSHSLKRFPTLIATLSLAVAFMLLVPLGVYPEMFEAGTGLTTEKIALEWAIMSLLALAAYVNWRHRAQVNPYVMRLILTAIGFTVLSELMFTLYVDVYGKAVVIGHIFKLFSFWAIYVALIDSCLKEPVKALARGANTYDAIPEQISVVDKRGVVREVNKSICDALNKDASECIEKSCHELFHNPEVNIDDCEICYAITNGTPFSESVFLHPEDGSWYRVNINPVDHLSHGAGFIHVRRDITESKVARDRLDTLNHLYTVQSQFNKAIISATDRQALFQDICDIAVLQGQFLLSWVGMIDGHKVSPISYCGEQDYLLNTEIRVDDSELAKGPIGRSAKSGTVQFVNDTATDPTFAPWRDEALKRGYQSLAAVPFTANGIVLGIFTIYSQLPEVFDESMVALLDNLSSDLSRAMDIIDNRKLRIAAEKKLHSLSQAVEQSTNAIMITDGEYRIEYVNKAFSKLTGYASDEVRGRTPGMLRTEESQKTADEINETLSAGGEWHGKVKHRRKDGSEYWSHQSIFCVRDKADKVTHYVSTAEDQTELHEAQETIKQLAFYDPLTELPNRRLLSDRFEQLFSRLSRRKDAILAVMLLDLDNFKTVNDSLGHNVGDLLLKNVAGILQDCVRKEDTVARLGGDEFAILIGGASIDRITDIADNIVRRVCEPIELEGNIVQVGASIGIALYPQDAKESDELMRNADLAMYHAKSEGKNNFQFYRTDLNSKAHDRLVLENRIRSAIDNEHFQLYYQPQIDLSTGDIVGLEALIRWIDPEHGVISPAEFIPLAEDTGMIGRIGDWVIETACKEVHRLHQAGLPGIKVAVNVSAHQFRKGDHLCQVVQSSLDDSGLSPEFLSLELTESILIDDISETINSLNNLKGLNITLAIDDFGTGYSSLSYLKTFPIDVLKIDQSFIRDILVDDSDKAIVTAIIAMSKQLDLNVLAEGVETEAHNNFLREFGCDYAQGYYYCKPVPIDELIKKYT